MKKVPLKSGNALVIQKMLSNVKSERKCGITAVSLEVRSLRSEMNVKLEKVIAAIYRTNALVEKQSSGIRALH